ncbi:MAG TPA: hypothetical protein VM618_02800 [Acidimicrobiia bacterium]|nr:hypothetical protein [Acidimicrobiia bacterium]
MATVPFESYRLLLRADDVRDLSRAVEGRRGADELRIPAVEARYRLAGIDATDMVESRWYTFVRRGDRWFVNADDDLDDLSLLTQRHLWDAGPVAFTGADRVTVMSAPGDADRAEALRAIAEEGYDRLRSTLDWEAPPKVLLVLPRSVDELEAMLQTTFDLTNFVAFAVADVDRGPDANQWTWTSPRVFAQETNLSRHSRDFQVETLHHELVHVVGFPKAGPHIPNWLHEGHADFLALGRPAPSAVAGSDGSLPLDHQFVTGGRDRILRSYRESTSAAAFLAEAKGPDAPSRLFEVLGAVRLEPGTWRYHLDQALEEVYGAGVEEFEAAWNGGR